MFALQSKVSDLSFAIIVGNLFAGDDGEVADLLAGKINVPLRTYFTIGSNPLPKSVEEKLAREEMVRPPYIFTFLVCRKILICLQLCENLYYLTKRSTTKTSEGIRIVTLGGKLDDSNSSGLSQDDFQPFHTSGDAKALKGANTADILLTSQWPSLIRGGSNSVIPAIANDPLGDESISDLCATIRPRYHFSASNTFFEREPFFHLPTSEAPDIKPVTRFVSLAPFGNPGKQKSIYAFQLSAVPPATIPLGSTASPFRWLNRKRRQDFDSTPFSRFGTQEHRDKRPRMADNRAAAPDKCFFCMGAPEFKAHLVTAIGEDSYLALPKGPLTTSTTNSTSGISFPAHILLCPIIHSPTLATVIDKETGENRSEATYDEMTRFRKSLQAMVSSLGKGALGSVTYEISRDRNVHNQWQFLPINQKYTSSQSSTSTSLVEAGFQVEAENMSYPAFQPRDPGVGLEEGDFFRVWIWTPSTAEQPEGSEKCLTMSLDGDKRFDLQFGRRVLAKLLNLENRTNWREFEQTEDEEKADAAAFQDAFKEFDFS